MFMAHLRCSGVQNVAFFSSSLLDVVVLRKTGYGNCGRVVEGREGGSGSATSKSGFSVAYLMFGGVAVDTTAGCNGARVEWRWARERVVSDAVKNNFLRGLPAVRWGEKCAFGMPRMYRDVAVLHRASEQQVEIKTAAICTPIVTTVAICAQSSVTYIISFRASENMMHLNARYVDKDEKRGGA